MKTRTKEKLDKIEKQKKISIFREKKWGKKKTDAQIQEDLLQEVKDFLASLSSKN